MAMKLWNGVNVFKKKMKLESDLYLGVLRCVTLYRGGTVLMKSRKRLFQEVYKENLPFFTLSLTKPRGSAISTRETIKFLNYLFNRDIVLKINHDESSIHHG